MYKWLFEFRQLQSNDDQISAEDLEKVKKLFRKKPPLQDIVAESNPCKIRSQDAAAEANPSRLRFQDTVAKVNTGGQNQSNDDKMSAEDLEKVRKLFRKKPLLQNTVAEANPSRLHFQDTVVEVQKVIDRGMTLWRM